MSAIDLGQRWKSLAASINMSASIGDLASEEAIADMIRESLEIEHKLIELRVDTLPDILIKLEVALQNAAFIHNGELPLAWQIIASSVHDIYACLSPRPQLVAA